MNTSRRRFLKNSAFGTGLLFSTAAGYSSILELKEDVDISQKKAKKRKSIFNMCGYATSPLPTVRIGYVGIGSRGSTALKRMTKIKGVVINALCDIKEEAVKKGQKILKEAGWSMASEYYGSDQSFKKLCERGDIDLVYIVTSWEWHTPIAVYAMEHGKHAVVEVPAARTLEECWNLVETSERTKRHCMQLENCCYGFFEMLTLNMSRQGVFGELGHAEGAYIHTLGDAHLNNKKEWRLDENLRNGNLYPTHGLGPVCQALEINRGDQLEQVVSMSTNDFQMEKRIQELSAQDPFYRKYIGKKFRGNMNTSVIKTYKGKTIMLQHDVTSPRVYDRKHLISGTLGMAQEYPLPGKIAFGHEWVSEVEMKKLEEKYIPGLIRHIGATAKSVGGHGGMDYIMDWRLIDCLHKGLPLDQDVYDAALWSAITPLSIWSVAHRSQPVNIPDFTGGHWKTNRPHDLSVQEVPTGNMKD